MIKTEIIILFDIPAVYEGRGMKDTGWFGGKTVESIFCCTLPFDLSTHNCADLCVPLFSKDPYIKFRIIGHGNKKGDKFKTLICRNGGSNPDWRGEHHSFKVKGNHWSHTIQIARL